jgi:nitrate reductase gamma subunit
MGAVGLIVLAAAAVAAAGLWRHLAIVLGRPFRAERARPAGSPAAGVRYAFTLGMMPWAKESTRLHLLAYLRGIVFHAGIGAGLLGLVLGVWRPDLPFVLRLALVAALAVGAAAGWAGLAARVVEPGLRALSTPDDYLAVALVSAFLTAGALAWWDARWMGVFLLVGAATLVAIPFTKIRHCFYYFFSRYFFGLFYGRRGVLGGAHHE